jgi:hypothetical protein
VTALDSRAAIVLKRALRRIDPRDLVLARRGQAPAQVVRLITGAVAETDSDLVTDLAAAGRRPSRCRGRSPSARCSTS